MVNSCRNAGFGDALIHVKTVSEAKALKAPGVVVACIPLITPETKEETEARRVVEAFIGKEGKGAMLEMCYHPTLFTELGELGEMLGWLVILGTEAMIYQGLEQDRYWTGKEIEDLPNKEVHVAIADALKARWKPH